MGLVTSVAVQFGLKSSGSVFGHSAAVFSQRVVCRGGRFSLEICCVRNKAASRDAPAQRSLGEKIDRRAADDVSQGFYLVLVSVIMSSWEHDRSASMVDVKNQHHGSS